MWQRLVDADAAHYIIMAATAGSSDQTFNACGVANSHAYTVFAVFTMTDADGIEHRMLHMRNPWRQNRYNWHWNLNDARWTPELIAQIPHGFDPTAQSNSQTGMFVVPFEAYFDNTDVGYCFRELDIGHNRATEGYVDKWYDVIDANHDAYTFEYTATTNTHPIYFTSETYAYNIVPYHCMLAYDWEEGFMADVPIIKFSVKYGDETVMKWYGDYMHVPIMIDSYDAGQVFEITVHYNWFRSARKDFTVKVYSMDGNDVVDEDGLTNMLHTDGQEPSEFDYIKSQFPDGREVDYDPHSGIFEHGDGCRDTDDGKTDIDGDDCAVYAQYADRN